jgi:hypothetical protein
LSGVAGSAERRATRDNRRSGRAGSETSQPRARAGEELLGDRRGCGVQPVADPAPLARLGDHPSGLGQQGEVFGDGLPDPG